MKQFVFLFLVSVTFLASYEGNLGTLPKFRLAIESATAESEPLRDFLRERIQTTGKGLVTLPLTQKIRNLSFDEKGLPSPETDVYLRELTHIDKLLITATNKGQVTIRCIDLLQRKLEYEQSLPESLTKSLVTDFFAYLEERNIYLALSQIKTEQTNQSHELKAVYTTGGPVRYELESASDSFVYVVLVPENKTAGTVLLFPNSLQRDNFVKRGDRIVIPDLRIAQSPTGSGRDRLRVFASREEWKGMQFKSQKETPFFQLGAPALTGAKSLETADIMTSYLQKSQVRDWEF